MAYKYGDGSRSDELIRLMIPVMVLWAKYSWNEFHTYSDLQNAINAKSPRLGHQLGLIDDLFFQLSEKYERSIPTLNALIANAATGLPSNGFDYVDSNYSFLSKEDKEALAKGKNEEAHSYDYTWVLDVLGLELPTLLDSSMVKKTRERTRGYTGGESLAHKNLKKFIASHPEEIDISDWCQVDTEHILVSGDRLDVIVRTPTSTWAIEVKSNISDEQDILRGIFQCVKYKAVLEAEKVIEKNGCEIRTLLVLEGTMPEKLQSVAKFLNVDYIDNFSIPL